MSDYISKSELIKAIDEQVQGWGKQGIVPSLFSAIAIVQNQPTLDEKEIIRKAFERVVERLEVEKEQSKNIYEALKDSYYLGMRQASENAIQILKEECGISE